MLHRVCASALGLLALAAGSASASTFDSITNWTGTGANRAALVIDWNDGLSPASLAFGYRWDAGSPNAEQMFLDIVRADPRLFAKVGTANTYGTPLYGIGYDADLTNGFGITDAGTFDADGVATVSDTQADGGLPSFAGDRYVEGWFNNGFWSQYASATDPFAAGGSWSEGFGLAAATLSDGEFIGLSFDRTFPGTGPDNPVPEPMASLVLAGAGGVVVGRRRRA